MRRSMLTLTMATLTVALLFCGSLTAQAGIIIIKFQPNPGGSGETATPTGPQVTAQPQSPVINHGLVPFAPPVAPPPPNPQGDEDETSGRNEEITTPAEETGPVVDQEQAQEEETPSLPQQHNLLPHSLHALQTGIDLDEFAAPADSAGGCGGDEQDAAPAATLLLGLAALLISRRRRAGRD